MYMLCFFFVFGCFVLIKILSTVYFPDPEQTSCIILLKYYSLINVSFIVRAGKQSAGARYVCIQGVSNQHLKLSATT